MDQVTTSLLSGLDHTWDAKGINGHVRVSQPGAGYDKHLPPLKYAYISV